MTETRKVRLTLDLPEPIATLAEMDPDFIAEAIVSAVVIEPVTPTDSDQTTRNREG